MILQTCWNYQSCKENQQNPELNARSGKRHCPKNTISLPPPEIARSNSMSNSEPRTHEKRSLLPHCLTAEQPASRSPCSKIIMFPGYSHPEHYNVNGNSQAWGIVMLFCRYNLTPCDMTILDVTQNGQNLYPRVHLFV